MKLYHFLSLLLVLGVLIAGCKKESNDPVPCPDCEQYEGTYILDMYFHWFHPGNYAWDTTGPAQDTLTIIRKDEYIPDTMLYSWNGQDYHEAAVTDSSLNFNWDDCGIKYCEVHLGSISIKGDSIFYFEGISPASPQALPDNLYFGSGDYEK